MDKLIRNLHPGSRYFNSSFPVISAGYIYGKNYFWRQTFRTINFVFVLSGSGQYYWKNKFLAINAPAVLVQPPDEKMRFGPHRGKTWDEVHFVLPKDALTYILEKKLWDGKSPSWKINNINEVLATSAKLKELLDKPLHSIHLDRLDYICEQLLIESILPSTVKTESKYYDIVNEIYNDMKKLSEYVDMDAYCQKYNISMPTLRRYWLKYMGMPPAKFRIDMIIREACSLLTNTDLSINEISEKLNFTEQFYFSRQFKKETGYSPLEYRKMFYS